MFLWRGAGMKLLSYRIKTTLQYCYTLKEFMQQDEVFNSYMLTVKDIYSQSQQYFEYIQLVSIFGEE